MPFAGSRGGNWSNSNGRQKRAPGATVHERLEQLVGEMVDKGILYEEAQREFERKYIAKALLRAGGNLSRASALLGIHRNTLTRKIAAYRLKRRG